VEDEGKAGRAIKTVGRTIKPKARASVLLITLARAVVSGETATPHIRLRSIKSERKLENQTPRRFLLRQPTFDD
jgi:hypothetical protein